MKRTLLLASAALVALMATSFAVAKGLDGNTRSARAVAGTFTAATASKVETRTCTTSDGKTLVSTKGLYTGAATGDADLTGNATLRASSLINTTDNIGVVSGTLRIDVASGRDTQAQFDAVFSGGQIAGLATGHAHDPAAKLVANLSAEGGGSDERQHWVEQARRALAVLMHAAALLHTEHGAGFLNEASEHNSKL